MEQIVQGTPEWFAARVGKVTASRVADVVAKTKTGPAAARGNYMAELIAERLTGVQADRYTNSAMQWGHLKEPEARAHYEFMRDVDVAAVGFVPHPTIAMTGASPDGLVGDEGLLEIKCPITANHLETLTGRAVPGKYLTQMHWQMACTGRKWCDFVSYDPRLPEDLRYFSTRVMRDDVKIAELEAEVDAFLRELDRRVADLRDFASGAVAA